MAADNRFYVVLHGTLESAEHAETDHLYCRFNFVKGKDWEVLPLSDDNLMLDHGITQMAERAPGVPRRLLCRGSFGSCPTRLHLRHFLDLPCPFAPPPPPSVRGTSDPHAHHCAPQLPSLCVSCGCRPGLSFRVPFFC